MTVKPISYSYWRSIQRGNRAFEDIPESVKEDVRYLAKVDVENGKITAEQYKEFIGEDYVAEVAENTEEN